VDKRTDPLNVDGRTWNMITAHIFIKLNQILMLKSWIIPLFDIFYFKKVNQKIYLSVGTERFVINEKRK